MLRRILRIVRGFVLAALTLIALGAAASWINTKWNHRRRYDWPREFKFEWGAPDHRRFCFVVSSRRSPGETPVIEVCVYDRDAPPTDRDWEWSLRHGTTFTNGWSGDSSYSTRDYRETWDAFLTHYETWPRGYFVRTYEVTAPAWVPLVVCGAWPVLAGSVYLRRRRRMRYRRTHGLCLKCGYNLTGLPNPQCPECGTGFDPKPGKVLT